MARRCHICWLEPWVACILACIHNIAALDKRRQDCNTQYSSYSKWDENLHEVRPYWDPDVNGTFFQLKLPFSRKVLFLQTCVPIWSTFSQKGFCYCLPFSEILPETKFRRGSYVRRWFLWKQNVSDTLMPCHAVYETAMVIVIIAVLTGGFAVQIYSNRRQACAKIHLALLNL